MSIEVTQLRGNTMKFVLRGVPASMANALRRSIISRVPVVAFKGFPDPESTVNITTNTSGLNNEILKQRFACIPIHLTDRSVDLSNYTVSLDVSATDDARRTVTTGDFTILWGEQRSQAPTAVVKALFPPDPITGDYIMITKLNPAIPGASPAERLALEATMYWTEGSEGGTASAACTCSYAFTPDRVKQEEVWDREVSESIAPSDHVRAKQDWLLGAGMRVTIPDSFDFIIESVGVHTPQQLLETACDIVTQGLDMTIRSLTELGTVQPQDSTLANAHMVKTMYDPYTIGHLLQTYMYAKHCLDNKNNYIGFRKAHPHDDFAELRVALESASTAEAVAAAVTEAATDISRVVASIRESIPDPASLDAM